MAVEKKILTVYYYPKCPDCGVLVGQYHLAGCDIERCMACGGQAISCECNEVCDNRQRWNGFWPGTLEAIEHGIYLKGTLEVDYNMIPFTLRWNSVLQRWIK